jgi:GrpB-like predicted nucleotidyltransferase (UPF0157 family)
MPSAAAILAPYDPTWPHAFEAEERRIRAALGRVALRVDHHGSTAVPGLSAKPIIDIQVSVASLQPLMAFGDSLASIGYTHLVHPDDAFAPFFFRPHGWPHTHHVHVVEAGGDEERRTLAFRDYLRTHPEAARAYEAVKRRLAAEHGGETAAAREAYASAKGPFIDSIIDLALGRS